MADSRLSKDNYNVSNSDVTGYSKIQQMGDNYFAYGGYQCSEMPFHKYLKMRGEEKNLVLSDKESIFDFFCGYLDFAKSNYFYRVDNLGDDSACFEPHLNKYLMINPYGIWEIHRWREVLEFKKFFAILSIELNIPVVPVVLDGTFESMPAGKLFPKPSPVIIKYLKPIYPEGLSYDELTAKVKNAIHQEMIKYPLHGD